MEATSKKYVVWLSDNQGEFVWADTVQKVDDTVSFMKKGKIEKSYKQKDIKEYNEVTNTK